jgi:limonene-1,2-epoxide hydrolase
VRSALVLALALAFVAAGCGGGGSDPRDVARAWAKALRADDNQRAASLFAADAVVIQGNLSRTFHTHQQAVEWNARLPCAGTIVALARRGSAVTATFRLGDRKNSRCGTPPGAEATAVFVVEGGKIILWVQTGSQIVIH